LRAFAHTSPLTSFLRGRATAGDLSSTTVPKNPCLHLAGHGFFFGLLKSQAVVTMVFCGLYVEEFLQFCGYANSCT